MLYQLTKATDPRSQGVQHRHRQASVCYISDVANTKIAEHVVKKRRDFAANWLKAHDHRFATGFLVVQTLNWCQIGELKYRSVHCFVRKQFEPIQCAMCSQQVCAKMGHVGFACLAFPHEIHSLLYTILNSTYVNIKRSANAHGCNLSRTLAGIEFLLRKNLLLEHQSQSRSQSPTTNVAVSKKNPQKKLSELSALHGAHSNHSISFPFLVQ